MTVDQRIKELQSSGSEIFDSVLRNGNAPLKVTILESKNVDKKGYVKYQDVESQATSKRGTAILPWIRIMGGPGVTMIPIVTIGGKELISMLYKPQPPVGEWSIELASGTVKKGENHPNAATRELREELKLNPGKIEYFGTFAHAKFRLGWFDRTYLMRDVVPIIGAVGEDNEEKATMHIALSIPQIKELISADRLTNSATANMLMRYIYFSENKGLEEYLSKMLRLEAEFNRNLSG